MLKNYLDLPAPAKVNLFLHIVGRRPDGYHLLQSVFQLIDLCDYLSFEETDNGKIERCGDIDWPKETDLCYKAALLLQQSCPQKGVRITVKKNIPHGAGLGGGSSDAATTLIALNRMWELDLPRTELMKIGEKLGADVPFFIFGQTAFVEGIGEIMQEIDVPDLQFLMIFPGISIPTLELFKNPQLTRNSKMCRISHLREFMKNFDQSPWGRNDMQKVAQTLYAPVDEALRMLAPYGSPRMTGSGSVVYAAGKNIGEKSVKITLPNNWRQWTVDGLKKHPLWSWTQ